MSDREHFFLQKSTTSGVCRALHTRSAQDFRDVSPVECGRMKTSVLLVARSVVVLKRRDSIYRVSKKGSPYPIRLRIRPLAGGGAGRIVQCQYVWLLILNRKRSIRR